MSKEDIITLFNNNVKGVEIKLGEQNVKHCGKEGHWLERKMGIKHNSKNEPDINGYEMKKSAKKKQPSEILVQVNMFFQKKETPLIFLIIGTIP